MTSPIHAEQILDQVVTLVTGLTTTGANVKRGKTYAFESSVNDAITVDQGADITESQDMARFHSKLNVKLFAYTRTTSETTTQLNKIRDEIFAALMADRKLGLSGIVIDTTPNGAEDPEESTDGSKPIARMEINYTVWYVHSVTDLGA